MNIAAMPSPRGTNREKLFILSGRRIAHDAAIPDPKDGDDPIDAVVAWAKENISDEGFRILISKLTEARGGATDDLGVPGKPGTLRSPAAMDEIPFEVRFPNAARFR